MGGFLISINGNKFSIFPTSRLAIRPYSTPRQGLLFWYSGIVYWLQLNDFVFKFIMDLLHKKDSEPSTPSNGIGILFGTTKNSVSRQNQDCSEPRLFWGVAPSPFMEYIFDLSFKLRSGMSPILKILASDPLSNIIVIGSLSGVSRRRI